MKRTNRRGRPPSAKFSLAREGRYDSKIPTLPSLVQHDFGDRITSHAQMELFLRSIVPVSKRMQLAEYGESYEGRKLFYAIVTSPTNHRTIDDIRENIAKLTDPRALEDEDEAERIIATTPSVVLVEANVHGGEHSSMEAALALAYHLTASNDDDVEEMLNDLVILIDPLQNPDGHERSVNWHYGAFGIRPNPDPNAAEHTEPWPGARGNHYLFDLNRDWFPLTQKESVQRVRMYLQWNPQVVMDLHEMGTNTTFFFAPPARPVNAHTPETVSRWWGTYGRAIAQVFDERGLSYFTREIFDSFYPGYGESWPTFHGATGMTFEQASVRGHAIRKKDESLLTFQQAIEQHFLATLAVLRCAASTRAERLRDFYRFHVSAISERAVGEIKEWRIVPSHHSCDYREVARSLLQQGIEIHQTDETFTDSSRPYLSDEDRFDVFPKGTLIIRMDQPKSHLIQTLFDCEPLSDEEFLKEEIARDQERRSERIYDVTCWSLPLMTGIEAFGSSSFASAKSTPLTASTLPSEGTVVGEGDYAFLLPWTSNAAASALVGLMAEDVRTRIACDAFSQNEISFGSGTIVIGCSENEPELSGIVDRIARESGARFVRTETGWQDSGISLGSMEVKPIKRPKIAMLYDYPVSTLSCGWMIHLLEQVYHVPFTALRWDKVGTTELNDYNVLVFPGGKADNYARIFNEKEIRRLKEWVCGGRTLVTIGGAARWISRPEHELTSVRAVEDLRTLKDNNGADSQKKEVSSKVCEKDAKTESPIPYEHRPKSVSGAVLRVRTDKNHFLTFGFPDQINVPFATDLLLKPSENGWNVCTFAEEERLRVAGFVWDRMLKALPGHAYLVDEPHENGHVILFADDPNFRGCWSSLNRLFLNAILFGPSLTRG